MKALVYRGPGQKALEERPQPALSDPTEAASTKALKIIIEA